MSDVAHLDTPVGPLEIEAAHDAIVRVGWGRRRDPSPTPLLEEALDQLRRYFAGELTRFDLPLAPAGNEFQQSVFRELLAIPYGETRTYGDLAARLSTFGQPIGQACGANPIPVIIPCHRVLSAGGLGGYSGEGGSETKIALLKLEGGFPFLL